MKRIDEGSKSAGQDYSIDMLDATMIHEQFGTRIKSGFCQLDRPNIILGDGDG